MGRPRENLHAVAAIFVYISENLIVLPQLRLFATLGRDNAWNPQIQLRAYHTSKAPFACLTFNLQVK